MTRLRACIYCRTEVRAAALAAEPIVPAALGGRLALKRAACPDCAPRVKQLADDFLARQFPPTVTAWTESDAGAASAARVLPSDARASDADWGRAHRAAAKILYCYLLLELGEAALASTPSELLRRHVVGDEAAPFAPHWEVTSALHCRPRGWHVLMFDSSPSAAAVGLFGTIWFRFGLDLAPIAPHGRLLTLDVARGMRGLAVVRRQGEWCHRTSIQWGWRR
jgi:HNH endonuclease